MKAQLKILSGKSSGALYVISDDEILLGRHPKADVQFDPENELDVSGRHAVIKRDGANWMLTDLDSRNGTFVNGHKITTPTKLDDTDQIGLSEDGPKVEFRIVADSVEDTAPEPFPVPMRKTGALRDSAEEPASVGAPKPAKESTHARVQAQVAKETRHLRAATVVLVVAVATVAGAAVYINQQQRRASAREIAALQGEIDSVLTRHTTVVASLQGEVEGLASALDDSRDELRGIQRQLTSAQERGDADRVTELRRQLRGAMAQLATRQSAAEIDYAAIGDANENALALIYAQFPDGTVQQGTAFAVRDDATLITNRHVVAGPGGDLRPTQLAIQFANSSQRFPGLVLAVEDDPAIDLAVIQVNPRNLGRGSVVRTVQGFNARPDTIDVGKPVAMIGFPAGTELPQREGANGFIASTTLVSGIVSKNIPGDIQIDGFAAVGASGSPIFDANGDVMAVLYGGRNERLLFAIPAPFVTQLMERIQ